MLCSGLYTNFPIYIFKLTLRSMILLIILLILFLFFRWRNPAHNSPVNFWGTDADWKVGPVFEPAFLILGHWWKHSSSLLLSFIYYGQDKKHWPMEDKADARWIKELSKMALMILFAGKRRRYRSKEQTCGHRSGKQRVGWWECSIETYITACKIDK